MGVEPTIFALATRCSTTELHPQKKLSSPCLIAVGTER